jgi:hypothetical protein
MTMKKAIRISEENIAAIEAALAAVNGKASTHCFTSFEEIAALAAVGEEKVADLLGAKKHAPGATLSARSGSAMPNSYDYRRKGTAVRLDRRATGWFLASVTETVLNNNGGGRPWVSLTPEQDARAVAVLRERYSVQAPAAVPAAVPA